MPITYRIDNGRKRIYSRATGVVTFEDLRKHMNAEAGSETASYSEVIDCTGATTDMTGDDVRRLADERRAIARRQTPAPVAVIATDDVFFGMLRMFDAHTSQIRPLQVFRNFADAETWLDTITGGSTDGAAAHHS